MTRRDVLDVHFLSECAELAKLSRDPTTRVGAMIVGRDTRIRATGYNTLSAGMDEAIYDDRDAKKAMIIHAEVAAIANAAKFGEATRGCTMYVLAVDVDGSVSGHPCSRCAVQIVHAGIARVVSARIVGNPAGTHADIALACKILSLGGVEDSFVTI